MTQGERSSRKQAQQAGPGESDQAASCCGWMAGGRLMAGGESLPHGRTVPVWNPATGRVTQ